MNSKISFTHDDTTYSVELNEQLESLKEVVDRLIVPVLLAATFSPVTIKQYIDSGMV